MEQQIDREDLNAIAELSMYVKSNMDFIDANVDGADRARILAGKIDPKKVVRSAMQPIIDSAQQVIQRVDTQTAKPVSTNNIPPLPRVVEPPPLPINNTHIQLELFEPPAPDVKPSNIEQILLQLHKDNEKIIDHLSKIYKSISEEHAS